MDEIECPDCDGNGWIAKIMLPLDGGMETVFCCFCDGTGWREPTKEEANDRAADAFSDMCEGEPPITMQERHAAAWKQKQELRR